MSALVNGGGSGWDVLFWGGIVATTMNVILLTLLAVSLIPLWENPTYMLYLAVVLGVATVGVILRFLGLKRVSGMLLMTEFLPQAFWAFALVGLSFGFDLLDYVFPAELSVAAPRPTD